MGGRGALGVRGGEAHLSKCGVLITRLSALHDIAAMTVLCSDKTGTRTRNEDTLKTLWATPDSSEEELLQAAAMASDPAGQYPIDGAVVKAATQRGWLPDDRARVHFQPFDPVTKRAEAAFRNANGTQHSAKGAPAVISKLTGKAESVWYEEMQTIVAKGQRVLAVKAGDEKEWRFLGLLGMEDAVREDSRTVVAAVLAAGVRVVMATGDNAITAATVARQVGIPGGICSKEALRSYLRGASLDCGVFAGVFPEQKLKLVRVFQRVGEVVGMSGDGVNNAPALRQAEIGAAATNSTDVAKAAAAIVFTRPGLGDVLPAIDESRRVFERIITN